MQASIFVRDVAPVVVKPLIISKYALLYDVKSPESTSGIAPNAVAIIQVRVTKRYPSLGISPRMFSLRVMTSVDPEIAVIKAMVVRKAFIAWLSSKCTLTPNGMSMSIPTKSIMRAKSLASFPKCILS